MARYRGPRARICRRLEFPVFESDKFSSIRKNYPPGQHGQSRRRKLSNYGVQLREKQRIKYLYGILVDTLTVINDTVNEGQTLGGILYYNHIDHPQIAEIVNKSKGIFDVRTINSGNPYTLSLIHI